MTFPSEDNKCVTFRKRRLSFPRHHLSTGNEDSAEKPPKQQQEVDEKASTFRKRRLSLTHTNKLEDEPAAQRRRSSAASVVASSQTGLQSRIVHAAELLGQHPPLSPANNGSILYHQQPLPPLPLIDTSAALTVQPKWKKRHHVHEEHKLPFPRDIVGTYSCHGVEPVYDSDYEHDDEADKDYIPEGQEEEKKDVSLEETIEKEEKEDKPSMVAKINQDRGGIAFPYGDCPKTALFAVYDGHGQGGELVSQFALHEVQRRLERHPLFHKDLKQAFGDVFLAVDDALRQEPLIEPLFAGTTACVALLQDKQLTIANVGDSRAVLARKRNDNTWEALDLTVDQNPDLPEEQRRIAQAGGYVSPSPGPGLSARVWLDQSYTQIGLAMARSLGDHAVSPVGVIADPIVTTHEIGNDDDFMILASDGVWEFIDSEKAVQIVNENLLERGATKACQALIETAAAEWHREEGEYRDDITAIVVRLQDLWTTG